MSVYLHCDPFILAPICHFDNPSMGHEFLAIWSVMPELTL